MPNSLIINGPPANGGAAGNGGFKIVLPGSINLGAGGTTATSLRGRNGERIAAIAAAVAVDDPGDTLQLARRAAEKPDEVLDQPLTDGETREIRGILDEIKEAQDDTAAAVEISAAERAAAQAVGASPRLVAVAVKAIAGHADVARRWAIRLVDPATFERAARASAKAVALTAFDAGAGATTINARLDALEATDKKTTDELHSAIEQLRKATEDLKTMTDSVKTLADRVTRLEAPPARGGRAEEQKRGD